MGATPKELLSDGALEYSGGKFARMCEEKCIRKIFSTPHRQAQNGVAENIILQLTRMVTASIARSGLGTGFWCHALEYASHVHNLHPHTALEQKWGVPTTPWEAMKGTRPDVRYLRSFGCETLVLLDKRERRRFEGNCERGIHLGLSINHSRRTYDIYMPRTKKVWRRMDCVFNESVFPAKMKINGNEGVLEGDDPPPVLGIYGTPIITRPPRFISDQPPRSGTHPGDYIHDRALNFDRPLSMAGVWIFLLVQLFVSNRVKPRQWPLCPLLVRESCAGEMRG